MDKCSPELFISMRNFILNAVPIQSNFNGSNSFETMEICSRYGQFELPWVNHIARSGGKWEYFMGVFDLL